MLYVIVLVVLLMLLSGIIAYTGDVLGTWVGKRRLSLFGVRPKQTGRIIGVIAGILIMIATLTVLALVNRQATRVILNAQQNAEQLAVTGEQLAALNRQVTERTRELELARDELERAQQEVDRLARERDSLETTVNALNRDVLGLRAAIGEFGEALLQAEAELRQAERALEGALAQLVLAQRERLEAEADAEAARSAVSEAQAQVDALQAELAQLNRQLEATTAELAASRQELSAAQAALASANDELAAALAAREAAQLQIDELERAQRQLTEQIEAQNAELAELNLQIARLTDTAAELRGQNLELRARNRQLVEINGELEQINQSLFEEVAQRNAQLQLLEAEVAQLKEDSRRQVQQIEYLQAQAAAINEGLTFQRAEVIASGIITAKEPTAIREQLAQLRALANQRSAERGGGDIILETAQIERLVNEIAQTPGDHVVIFRAQTNHFALSEVRVDVEAFENRKLFSGGQLLVSRQLHLGTSLLATDRDTVRNNVQLLWQAARGRLLQAGLADGASPTIAPTSPEIEGFTNQLLRLTGPVTIGLQARRDIFAAGPADLEFVIIQ